MRTEIQIEPAKAAEGNISMVNTSKRERLPEPFEGLYKSEDLKEKITDPGLWTTIPCVDPDMYSKNGIKRLRENHVLFAFIDQYFSKDQYAFEPNMEDGRFVFLPENVFQQGIGLAASKELPGWLEVMFFWYPGEYTEKSLPIGCAQCSVSSFTSQPGDRLADMIREIYMNTKLEPWGQCCIFAFNIDVIVRLNGNYMDHIEPNGQRSTKIKRFTGHLLDTECYNGRKWRASLNHHMLWPLIP